MESQNLFMRIVINFGNWFVRLFSICCFHSQIVLMQFSAGLCDTEQSSSLIFFIFSPLSLFSCPKNPIEISFMETCSVHKSKWLNNTKHRGTERQPMMIHSNNKRKCLFTYDSVLVKMNDDSSNFIT